MGRQSYAGLIGVGLIGWMTTGCQRDGAYEVRKVDFLSGSTALSTAGAGHGGGTGLYFAVENNVYCNRQTSTQAGSTIHRASVVRAALLRGAGTKATSTTGQTPNTVVCQDTVSDLKASLRRKTLDWQPLRCSVAPGQYTLFLYDPQVVTDLRSASFQQNLLLNWQRPVIVGGDGRMSYEGILPGAQIDEPDDMSMIPGMGGTGDVILDGTNFVWPTPLVLGEHGEPDCDISAGSPLVVKTNVQAGAIDLTAPSQGILFDILGQNARPVAHTPERISWVHRDKAMEYKFLVLPDGEGRVTGIDQMFGDNTRGPDGRFADNGYAALAKYDGKDRGGVQSKAAADGLIDADDEIYPHLRLWADLNGDGQAQAEELTTLEDEGLESIDLNYDASYFEQDRYGNQTTMRSVANHRDGGMRLVFDLWFVLRR